MSDRRTVGPDQSATATGVPASVQHVPVARTAQLIADLTGARPSTGWVSSALSLVAEVLVDVEKLIKSFDRARACDPRGPVTISV